MSFIQEKRKEQIIKSCIEELSTSGYKNMTFKNIAKRIDINPSLVSYHFSSKETLLLELLEYILEHKTSFILSGVKNAKSAADKICKFMNITLEYHKTHRSENIALIEIIFNLRFDNQPLYLLDDDEEDSVHNLFKAIIQEGIDNGEFEDTLDVEVLSTIVNGALDERMLSFDSHITDNEFIKVLMAMIGQYIKKEVNTNGK